MHRPSQQRIGPILLAPRVGPKQVLVFLFVTSICVFVNEFANVIQPLIPAVWALFILRFVWGLSLPGFSAGAATISMDIPDNAARRKLNNLVLVSNLVVASPLVLPAARLRATRIHDLYIFGRWIAGWGRLPALFDQQGGHPDDSAHICAPVGTGRHLRQRALSGGRLKRHFRAGPAWVTRNIGLQLTESAGMFHWDELAS